MRASSSAPLAGRIVIDLKKVWGVFTRREQWFAHNEVREASQDRFGVREIQNLLKVGVGLRVAGIAKRCQVLGRIIALVKRDASPAPVDVVNVKTFGCTAFPAGVSVALNDCGLVRSKEMSVFGNFAPFSALDVRLIQRVRAIQFMAMLARPATTLRAGLQNIGSPACNTDLWVAYDAASFCTATGREPKSVLFGFERRFAFGANLLRRTCWLVRSATSLAFSCDGSTAVSSVITPPGPLAELQLGSIVGVNLLNSPLLFAGIAPDLTDAQLQALTASNGFLMDFL